MWFLNSQRIWQQTFSTGGWVGKLGKPCASAARAPWWSNQGHFHSRTWQALEGTNICFTSQTGQPTNKKYDVNAKLLGKQRQPGIPHSNSFCAAISSCFAEKSDSVRFIFVLMHTIQTTPSLILRLHAFNIIYEAGKTGLAGRNKLVYGANYCSQIYKILLKPSWCVHVHVYS